MKKGIHPALQWLNMVSPDGRLTRVLSAKIYNVDKTHYITDPGKQAEHVGRLGRFNRRYKRQEKTSFEKENSSSEKEEKPSS